MSGELPESLATLLSHVQERALAAPSEKLAGRLVRLLRSVSPRVVTAASGGGNASSEEVLAIDLDAVRSLCGEGIPDEVPALRAAFWKVVLGYLPTNAFLWDTALKSSRDAYTGFVEELLEHLPEEVRKNGGEQSRNPSVTVAGGVDPPGDTASVVPNCDECASPAIPPSWSANECDARSDDLAGRHTNDGAGSDTNHNNGSRADLEDIIEQINKDIYRTRPELDFFARRLDGRDIEEDREWSAKFRGGEGLSPQSVDLRNPQRHYDALARVLLLFGRLNPGIRYVQGMNEICAPIYYLFAQDPLQAQDAEADTFFCFSLVMAGMRDAFVKSLDHTEGGMIGRIGLFHRLLRAKDPQVWQHLENQSVSPLFYSVRWLTLMLTQELEMPDVFRVWDSLLCDTAKPYPLLFYLCVTMVMHIRKQILAADFTGCMSLLQHYPEFEVEEFLAVAADLQSSDHKDEDAASLDAPADAERVWAAAVVSDAEKAALTQAASGLSGAAARRRHAVAATALWSATAGNSADRGGNAPASTSSWASKRQAWSRVFSGSAEDEGGATGAGRKHNTDPDARASSASTAASGRQAPAWVRGIGRWLDAAMPERPP